MSTYFFACKHSLMAILMFKILTTIYYYYRVLKENALVNLLFIPIINIFLDISTLI